MDPELSSGHLGKLRQEDDQWEVRLSNLVRPRFITIYNLVPSTEAIELRIQERRPNPRSQSTVGKKEPQTLLSFP